MILIDSDNDDLSTIDVQDWLYYLDEKNYQIRNNGIQEIKSISIGLSSKNKFSFKYHISDQFLNSKDLDGYWYRRGVNIIDNTLLYNNSNSGAKDDHNKGILKYLIEENKAVFDVLNHLKGEVKPSIGNFNNNFTNKLINLMNASKYGILIPETLVSNNKDEIFNFIEKNKKVIVKNIAQAPFIQSVSEDGLLVSIDFENFILNQIQMDSIMKDELGLSLFQRYIEKKVELRIFFLNDIFFTTAIFSQTNEKTKIDYRNYDRKRPNRTVPFNLPESIKKKISRLMKSLNMNCGTIDMIYSTDNNFYFLEINPIGQFKGNEMRCNFYISKLIASTLLKDKS